MLLFLLTIRFTVYMGVYNYSDVIANYCFNFVKAKLKCPINYKTNMSYSIQHVKQSV